MRENRPGQGVPHSAPCRARIEEAMREAGDPRLQAAQNRHNTVVAEALAAGEEEAEAVAVAVAAAAVTPVARWQGPEAPTKVRARKTPEERQAKEAVFAAQVEEEEGPPELIDESDDEDGQGEPRDEVETDSDEDDADMIGLIPQGMPKEVAANFVSSYELF